MKKNKISKLDVQAFNLIFSDNAWKTDDTLKITHYREADQRLIMMSARLIGVMSSSLILLALMMKGLGISGPDI